jgi:hypothetical protein
MRGLGMSAAGLNGAVERARKAAEVRTNILRARVRARIVAALPGVRVEEQGDSIVLSGRGLVDRWVANDALRDLREVEP